MPRQKKHVTQNITAYLGFPCNQRLFPNHKLYYLQAFKAVILGRRDREDVYRAFLLRI